MILRVNDCLLTLHQVTNDLNDQSFHTLTESIRTSLLSLYDQDSNCWFTYVAKLFTSSLTYSSSSSLLSKCDFSIFFIALVAIVLNTHGSISYEISHSSCVVALSHSMKSSYPND